MSTRHRDGDALAPVASSSASTAAAWSAGTPAGARIAVRAASLGDPAAWAAIVHAHAQQVWDVARSADLRPDEAGAVCDVVWRRLAHSIPDVGDLPLAMWLRQVTLFEAEQARLRAGFPTAAEGDRRRHARALNG